MMDDKPHYIVPTWKTPETPDSSELCPICGSIFWWERYETSTQYHCKCATCGNEFVANKDGGNVQKS